MCSWSLFAKELLSFKRFYKALYFITTLLYIATRRHHELTTEKKWNNMYVENLDVLLLILKLIANIHMYFM